MRLCPCEGAESENYKSRQDKQFFWRSKPIIHSQISVILEKLCIHPNFIPSACWTMAVYTQPPVFFSLIFQKNHKPYIIISIPPQALHLLDKGAPKDSFWTNPFWMKPLDLLSMTNPLKSIYAFIAMENIHKRMDLKVEILKVRNISLKSIQMPRIWIQWQGVDHMATKRRRGLLRRCHVFLPVEYIGVFRSVCLCCCCCWCVLWAYMARVRDAASCEPAKWENALRLKTAIIISAEMPHSNACMKRKLIYSLLFRLRVRLSPALPIPISGKRMFLVNM